MTLADLQRDIDDIARGESRRLPDEPGDWPAHDDWPSHDDDCDLPTRPEVTPK